MILSLTLTTNLVVDTVRLEIQTNRIPPIFSHMRGFPKSVRQADTTTVSCGLANFERTSWSTHRRHEFWGSYEELDTGVHYDKFVGSFEDNYPGMCDGRSIWMIDCRKFDDPGHNKSLRNHIGRNPRITKSIMISKKYHVLHSRLYDGMPRFFSSKNMVIMICRSGRHRSVANAVLWSNTVARYSRRQHSVSLLLLSGLDFWKDTCGKMFGVKRTVYQNFSDTLRSRPC